MVCILEPLIATAIATAALPAGLKLYTRLDRMRECMVLGGNVHLLYVLQIEAQFEIFDWGMLKQFLKTLTPLQRQVSCLTVQGGIAGRRPCRYNLMSRSRTLLCNTNCKPARA